MELYCRWLLARPSKTYPCYGTIKLVTNSNKKSLVDFVAVVTLGILTLVSVAVVLVHWVGWVAPAPSISVGW